jgi:hypothetical protein
VTDQALLDVMQAMRTRAHDVRTRAAIRSWKYRQRNLAAGVWFQVRRALAAAQDAYAISDADARQLLDEGYKPDACGARLEPQKTIIFVDSMRLSRIESRGRIPYASARIFCSPRASRWSLFNPQALPR